MQTFTYFTLVPMVYIAVAVFVVGTVARIFKIWKAPSHPTTLQIYPEKGPAWLLALHDTFLFPTIRKHKPLLWGVLMVFHVCLLLLLVGHLELIKEFDTLQLVPHEVFLGRGLIGLCLVLCLLFFLFRRLKSPVRELSVPEDYLLLILLFVVVIFGSQMDWARSLYGYEEMGVEDYREYLMGLLTFQTELPYAVGNSGHSFMLVLHVFFANLFLIFFPFSQLMHALLSLPMNKLRRG